MAFKKTFASLPQPPSPQAQSSNAANLISRGATNKASPPRLRRVTAHVHQSRAIQTVPSVDGTSTDEAETVTSSVSSTSTSIWEGNGQTVEIADLSERTMAMEGSSIPNNHPSTSTQSASASSGLVSRLRLIEGAEQVFAGRGPTPRDSPSISVVLQGIKPSAGAPSSPISTQALEHPSLDPPLERTRHPDLWFKDGSVVLAADHTMFKVHQSLLARHSAFFRDLFSLPQPPNMAGADPVETGEETIEGCPVLQLQDDPEDVEVLLGAMYDGIGFGNNDVHDFKIVSGILRLSSKYIVDALRNKALTHLHVAWPRTLKGWDTREDARQSYEMTRGKILYPSPIAVINLAREIDEPSLLPAAFYDLSRFPLLQIFDSSEGSSSPTTVSPPSPGRFDSHIHNFPSGRPHTLSLLDTQNLVLGREAAHNAIITLIQAMNSPVSSNGHASQTLSLALSSSNAGVVSPFGVLHGHVQASYATTSASTHPGPRARACMSAAACRKDFSELVELATQHYLFDKERGSNDPLYVAEELGQLKSAEFSECKACAASLEVWAARERERMWKLIPLWFRLET